MTGKSNIAERSSSNDTSDSSRLLTLGLFDFRDPLGTSFTDRCTPFEEWVDDASEAGYFQFFRYHESARALALDCLQHGARAGTPNVSFFPHNDLVGLQKRFLKIRALVPQPKGGSNRTRTRQKQR
jgi:hypothetical protein